MSYGFQVYLTPEASVEPEAWGALLRKVDGEADVEVHGRGATLKRGTWELRCVLASGPDIAVEAREIAQMFLSEDAAKQKQVEGCTRRIEVYPHPEGQTDDHYNTWLLAQEEFSCQPGMFVFSPFDGSFM